MSHTGGAIPLRDRLADRMRKTSPATLWGGLLLSLVFHAGMLAFVMWQMRPLGDGSPPNTGESEFLSVGIVEKPSTSTNTTSTASDSNETTPNAKFSAKASNNAKQPEVPDAPPIKFEQPNTGRAVIGPGMKAPAVAPRGNPGIVRPNSIGLPPSAAAGSHGTGKSSFFDVEIEGGKRIVYVLDRSPSMDGLPIAFAKQKLIGSLNGLTVKQRFQVIFFNDKVLAVKVGGPGADPLTAGSVTNVMQAKLRIESVRVDGGTDHKKALTAALEKTRSPDVIFFLTDSHSVSGQGRALVSADLHQIKKLNKKGARIHCIEFGEGADLSRGENFLKQLSATNRGKYVYVDVTKLRRR